MLEEKLEKIGAALHGILDVLRSIDDTLRKDEHGPAKPLDLEERVTAAVTTGEAQTAPRPTILPMSRQEIREKLDALGIAYNDRLRTDTLAKILEQEVNSQAKSAAAKTSTEPAAGATQPEEPKDVFGMPVQVEVLSKTAEKLYTLEEAIDFAKRLAAKFGPQKAVDIIAEFKSEKISDIEAKGKLQEFVKRVLEKEKEYERK